MRIALTLTQTSEQLLDHILSSSPLASRGRVLTAAVEAGLRELAPLSEIAAVASQLADRINREQQDERLLHLTPSLADREDHQ